MIIIHAELKVNPERREQFLEESKTLLTATHAEEGNLSYELYENAGEANSFIMVETWRDAEAVSNHNTSPHFTTFSAKAGEFLAAPLDVKVFSAEQVK
ncbi:putative quinol monooxygenase [Paenibacillus etheri]|uniref:Monooxygenase n=1 Tax=Paenibacillus etheri TaxID=1306852 RepID=A0A0W1APQ9_9BACL|nr:putative quinol monooxygenase [Paenibacillus etheri]KTD83311.1 monooxygenase [Paenibacillus etheri]